MSGPAPMGRWSPARRGTTPFWPARSAGSDLHVPDDDFDEAHRAGTPEQHVPAHSRAPIARRSSRTKYPKQIRYLPYTPGGEQAWRVVDVPFHSAYPTITGDIFEFGFTDAILQMWAAFCDELAHGRDGMRQPFYCVTPEEIAACA